MNYCNKCGTMISPGTKYCPKCGNAISNNVNHQQIINNQYQQNNQQLKNKPFNVQTKMILIGIGTGLGVVILLLIIISLFSNYKNKYYFNSDSYENKDQITQSKTTTTKKGKYSTVIIHDNTYSGVSISDDKDAYQLIKKDSISQKNNCPSEIQKVENEIIIKYGISAVNLCEMDVGFAKEISNVVKKIYDEYPSARGYITNLSLANVSMNDSYIAAFMPAFNFATSNTSSTYPWVIKTQVLLNTSYFLNQERLQASVTDGSNSGHFPPNATIYSPVAHEFGHYLSFLALMKNYQLNSILLVDNNNLNSFYELYDDFGQGKYSLQMIKEAYEMYKNDTNSTLSLDEWRGTISEYALAKDNNGDYIWDETIAESFHDVYLNKDSAKDASKYVVQVLKSKLEGKVQ